MPKTPSSNWAPITFAFTVHIGILAAVFVLILVFQAVLWSGPGPGRRKSSSGTIGKWASKTIKEWNWHDLNVISVARTPVIRSRRVQKVLEKMHRISLSHREATSTTEITQRPRERPTATWLRSLQHVDLQDLDIGDDDLEGRCST